jgi:hypothetical protein
MFATQGCRAKQTMAEVPRIADPLKRACRLLVICETPHISVLPLAMRALMSHMWLVA